MENTKKCTKCGRELPLDRFYKKKASSMGYKSECKDCSSIRAAEFSRNNPDKIKAEKAKYYQKNKDRVKAVAAEWHKNNPDKSKEASARWYQKNKGKVKEYGAKWYEDNKERASAYAIKWWRDNPTRNAEYKRKSRAEKPGFKIMENIRSAMNLALRGNAKIGHTIELLGCSIDEARSHLERQFKEGMTWDNWSRRGWHIDHIIPLEYFDFTDPEQQKQAWNYTNLRPLWATENIKKSNKIIEIQLVLI